jgi:metalloendopeptidase OMA1, mitochondrial
VFFRGKSHFAPLVNPKKVLDIGTGTGKWCIEFGKEFPRCEVTGTDLSPTQHEGNVPNNVRFIIDDANEDDWGIPPASLDYIHTRVMLGSFEDFGKIIQKAYYYLKPGGWLECQEYHQTLYCDDGTMPPDFPLKEWNTLQNEAAKNLGRQLRIGNKLKGWFTQCGFNNIREHVFKQPINTWPRDPQMKMIGRFSELSFLDGLQAFSLGFFHRGLGWTKEEIEVFLVPVRKSVSDRSVHAYHKM